MTGAATNLNLTYYILLGVLCILAIPRAFSQGKIGVEPRSHAAVRLSRPALAPLSGRPALALPHLTVVPQGLPSDGPDALGTLVCAS